MGQAREDFHLGAVKIFEIRPSISEDHAVLSREERCDRMRSLLEYFLVLLAM